MATKVEPRRPQYSFPNKTLHSLTHYLSYFNYLNNSNPLAQMLEQLLKEQLKQLLMQLLKELIRIDKMFE